MRGLVILVPGWGDPGVEWRSNAITGKLHESGYETELYIPENFGMGDIDRSAKRLAGLVKKSLWRNENIHVVGHSLGGLVATRSTRYANVGSITTIGTPHGGTKLANLASWSVSARQMAPGSLLLQANAKSTNCPLFSIACYRDALIWPRSSAIHPASTQKMWARRGHVSAVFSSKVASAVVDFIHKVDLQLANEIN